MAIERIPLNQAAIEADGEPRIADARIEGGEESWTAASARPASRTSSTSAR